MQGETEDNCHRLREDRGHLKKREVDVVITKRIEFVRSHCASKAGFTERAIDC